MHYTKAPAAAIDSSEIVISKAKQAGLHYARMFRKWNSRTGAMHVVFIVIKFIPEQVVAELAQLGFTSSDGKRFVAFVKE